MYHHVNHKTATAVQRLSYYFQISQLEATCIQGLPLTVLRSSVHLVGELHTLRLLVRSLHSRTWQFQRP